MSVASYRSNVDRLQRDIVDLKRQRDYEYSNQLRYQKDAQGVMSRMSNSSNMSISTLQSYMRDMQSKQDQAHQYEKKVTDLEKRIADRGAEISRNLEYLERELANQQRQQEQADKKRRDEEKRHQQDISRELDRQLRVRREMSNSTFSIDLTKLPSKITVLFLGSSPLDQGQLQLDEEARTIDRMIGSQNIAIQSTFRRGGQLGPAIFSKLLTNIIRQSCISVDMVMSKVISFFKANTVRVN